METSSFSTQDVRHGLKKLDRSPPVDLHFRRRKRMTKKRNTYSVEFKATVALDALSGEYTLAELASKYGVHASQVSQWKKQAKEGVLAAFSGKIQTSKQGGTSRKDTGGLFDSLSGFHDDPLHRAQDLMFEAWEAPTRKRAIALAKKALTISADCADAYSFLADQEAETDEEALELYRKGVEAGERALGKQFFKDEVGYFWGIIESRPYMRARLGLAGTLWELERKDEAVEHYQDMLRLNPGDNQGIRYILLLCLIELDRDGDAEALYTDYIDDGMAWWVYSRALLDFRKNGESKEAAESLKLALEENGFVPDYLLSRKSFPNPLPQYYSPGQESEAIFYAQDCRPGWEATPGALEWLGRNAQ